MSVTGSFTSAFSSVFSLVLSGINDLLFLVKCTLRQHCMYVAYLSPSQCNNSNAVSSKPAKIHFKLFLNMPVYEYYLYLSS